MVTGERGGAVVHAVRDGDGWGGGALTRGAVGCTRYNAVELPPAPALDSLETLRLNDNTIASWSRLGDRLGTLRHLHTLVLSDNPLCEVAYPGTGLGKAVPESVSAASRGAPRTIADGSGAGGAGAEQVTSGDGEEKEAPLFGALKCIHLSNTALGSWASVSALGRFPALR